MALGHNMKRKTLIPTSIEELKQHELVSNNENNIVIDDVIEENNTTHAILVDTQLNTELSKAVDEVAFVKELPQSQLGAIDNSKQEEQIITSDKANTLGIDKPLEAEQVQEQKIAKLGSKAFTETHQDVIIEFKPSLRTKVNKINVVISGKLNIYNTPFIVSKFKEHCASFDTVEVVAKDATDIDLTFVQFVYYYSQHKAQSSQLVTFDVEKPSSQLLNILHANNYTDLLIRKKLS